MNAAGNETRVLDNVASDIADGNVETSVELAPVRVKVHAGLCVGWGNCHRFAAAVYSLGEDGCVDFQHLEVPGELAEVARIGASVCPADAIMVIEQHKDGW